MKKLFTLAASLFFILSSKAQGPYTWTNADNDNDFENPNNWTPTPLFGFPSFGEVAIFDGSVSNDNCVMPNDEDFLTLSILSNYTGTVDASGIDLTLTNISIQGGAFLAPSNTLHVTGNFSKGAGGSYVSNSSSVLDYNITSSTVRTMSATITLPNLVVNASSSMGNRIINFAAGTATVTNLTLNTANYSLAVRGTVNVTDRLTLNGTSTVAATNNTGTILFVGATTKTITGTGTALANPLGRIAFNTTGAVNMSGNITVAQSWSVANMGTLNAGSSVTHLTGTASIAAGANATTAAQFHHLTFATGGTASIGTSWVNVQNDLTFNSSPSIGSGLIRFTGTGAQALTGTTPSITLAAIEVANSGTKTFGIPVSITDSVKVSAAGTLASGGNLRLVSTAGQKARIAEIAAGGSVSGNVIVENYLPGGTTGWANICSPGVTGQTMGSWNNAFAITCSGCPITDVNGSPFESIYWYNETLGAGTASNAAHYIPISGLGESIQANRGYWVYLGDNFPGTGDITPVLTGGVNTHGSVSYNLTVTGGVGSENGWNLISNPYPAPISLAKMFAGNLGNIDNTIQIWNTDLNGGAGNWAAVAAGSGVIPMGQAFMVRALSNVNLTSAETWKSTSNASVQKGAGDIEYDFSQLFRLNLKGGNNFDNSTSFDFKKTYSTGFDNGRDVYSLGNAGGSSYAQIFSQVAGEKYMIGAFQTPALNSYSLIPLHVATSVSGMYTITPENIGQAVGLCMQLVDLSNNKVHDLFNDGAYVANIAANDGSTPLFQLKVMDCGAAADPNPVSVQTIDGANNTINIGKDNLGVFVRTDFDQTKETSISVTNILGQKILDDKKVNAYKETLHLDIPEKNQVIFITVTTNDQKVTKKIVR